MASFTVFLINAVFEGQHFDIKVAVKNEFGIDKVLERLAERYVDKVSFLDFAYVETESCNDIKGMFRGKDFLELEYIGNIAKENTWKYIQLPNKKHAA